MKIQQIAIFMENKPGHLQTICRTLADAGINIRTISLADTQQYGILRLLTDNSDKAKTTLTQAGFVVNVTDVVAAAVDDNPGGLLNILDIISAEEINIEYMYAFTFRSGDNPIMVFRFDNPDKAIKALQSKQIKVISNIDTFKGDN